MSTSYLDAPGSSIEPSELCIRKAKELVQTLLTERLAFVTLVECRREVAVDAGEIIVINVEVERAQRTVHDIQAIERIAVQFFTSDQRVPEVLALRTNFPVVPHLNLRPQALPRSLCLFNEPYDEIKLRWTAAWFIERIRTWLAQTAKGELHAPDQPLEPLLLGAATPLILPKGLFTQHLIGQPVRLVVYGLRSGNGTLTYIAVPQEREEYRGTELPCVATVLLGEPQQHGIIQQLPQTISQLHTFMEAANVDLVGSLCAQFRQWQQDTIIAQILDRRLILIVVLPKTRAVGESIEATDIYAFVSILPIRAIGEQIGAWQMLNGTPGIVLGTDAMGRGEGIDLVVLNPMFSFSQEAAATFNGLSEHKAQPLVAIGLGALGSQLFMNLLRTGYAPWSLIDKDILLPHNLARHALDNTEVGYAKAETLALIANDMFHDPNTANALTVDVLHPGEHEAKLRQMLSDTTAILDMAASVPVARALTCDYESSARRISLFLNPTGTDLVLLAEDTDRLIRLDMLEMQYYRLIVQNEMLHRHLLVEDPSKRFARSCRDVSATIPQHLVGLLAGIGSQSVQTVLGQSAAHISVWQTHTADMTVSRIQQPPSAVVVQCKGDWRILTDSWLLEQLRLQREERLPNETGGVLIGAIDEEHRRIYVVLSVPSPPDSVEWPTRYIRGYQGLRHRVEEIDALTAGELTYIGEWHSHPQGYSCEASSDDQHVLQWLIDERAVDGVPGVMAIVSDEGVCWYVEVMQALKE